MELSKEMQYSPTHTATNTTATFIVLVKLWSMENWQLMISVTVCGDLYSSYGVIAFGLVMEIVDKGNLDLEKMWKQQTPKPASGTTDTWLPFDCDRQVLITENCSRASTSPRPSNPRIRSLVTQVVVCVTESFIVRMYNVVWTFIMLTKYNVHCQYIYYWSAGT